VRRPGRVQLLAENRHVGGGLDPESDPVSSDLDYRHHDGVADPDAFVFSSGEYEHEAPVSTP
jgi:hypothetical protein